MHEGQPAKIKVVPYHVSADANDAQPQNHAAEESKAKPQPSLTYKAIVELNAQMIE